MIIEISLILLGIVGLWIGSEIVVESSKKLARSIGISEFIIGITITSIGTSLPEISTNLAAGFSTAAGIDASGIAVGNIIGSNLSQITLLLGIAGFIATLTISRRSLRRDGTMMFLAIILMYLVCSDGYVANLEGIFLVVCYLSYLCIIVVQERVVEKLKRSRMSVRETILNVLCIFLGIFLIILGANSIVGNGVRVATTMNISESLIGIFVGLGTGIPELSVSVRAVARHSGRLSLGNLIGSNITDPLLSFGLGASVAGVNVSRAVLEFDFAYWTLATSIALLLLFNHLNLNKKESSILILLYLFFIYCRIFII
ncbi:MAG: hypothetical protein DRO95_00595 [Candidatus Altiarchaeales archaeon]|nr:MAG: hypothetical protein DRO95_00595 [Candidatus Altiarchaeales archaeon]HDO82183.1 calcium/sodium antiporter [Candidatus Altiarchaeales archaeon]HEX54832.1 calcium/sodium antiporter [Candidatus Altiarchaeales archaeon]